MRHIAIIGAGITGATTAYALIRRGYRVTVLDRNRYAASETSFANGGQLSACNAEVWNSWSTIIKGLGWMLKRDAPLLVNPTPSWHKYSWMGEFIGQIGAYRQNTIETTRLAIAARKHLFAIAEREKIQFDHEKRGILHVYHDKKSFDAATKVNALLKEGGLDRRAVSLDEMRAIEPTLRGPFFGGYFTPSDSTGDIMKFTRGLTQACIRQGGAFLFDANVHSIRHQGSKVEINWSKVPVDATEARETSTLVVDAIVVCAGVASRKFAHMLGDRVNIYPVKGYSISVGLESEASQKAAPWVSLLDDSAKIVTSRLGANRLRVAGTAEFNGENLDIRADRIHPLVNWTRTLFPDVSTEQVVPWAGLRPMMPNMLPRVGSGSRPGAFYNTGHGHLGWTLSAATADLVAERIAAQMPLDPVSHPLAA